MKKYAIQKGVPVPPRPKRSRSRPSFHIYPWAEMEVGDSFYVPADDEPRLVMDRVTQAAGDYRKRARGDVRFTLRTVRTGSIVGIRCWRIK